MVAHNEDFGSRVLHCLTVKLKRLAIEPTRPELLVVVEGHPDMSKLAHLRVVLAPPQIDDVGNSEGAKFFDVTPSLDRATEGQPLIDEEHFHLAAPFLSENGPSRL